MPVAATAQRSAPVARLDHWGSPTGGWNAIDNVTSMQPTDAMVLTNFVADTTNVRLRRGCIQHVQTSIASPIRTLMTYAGPTSRKLLAAGGGAIVDVTTAGSTGTAVASGFSSDDWEYVNFTTPGGTWIVAVNGTSTQYTYNGTAWTLATNTLGTGVTAVNFSTVTAYQQRLFFGGTNSLRVQYLPVNVFQGELHELDLTAYFTMGGVVSMLGTWTRDNGFGGSDDLLVVVSDQGELMLFFGVDPDLADGWNMTGRFVIGKPVSGHRALCRLGPDMMLICEDGFQPLTRYLALGQSQSLTTVNTGQMTAISRKIGNAVAQAVRAGKTLAGWQAILYPTSQVLIVNVPIAGGGFEQYVVNTINGAWSRFTGLNAHCWGAFEGGIYFGDDAGLVAHADNGGDDMGQPINFDLVTSFQMLGGNAQQKRATMVRPYITANGICAPMLDVNVDYNIAAVTAPIETDIAATEWDAFDWDGADWASGDIVQNNWFSVDGIGNAFSIHISGKASTTSLRLWAFDIAFESGVGFV